MGSATASVSGSSCGGDDDAGGTFDLARNYEKLYEHWLKLVEVNSDLAKEKAKLEAQVTETLKYASEKEEEARQAGAQLAETHKGLRMLNNGTDLLDHLLSIGQSDKCGLGYQGECSKNEGVFVSAGKTKDVATSATKPEIKMSAGKPAADVMNVSAMRTATATTLANATATAPERDSGLKSASIRKFRHVCHHCGVVGHIRPRCFKLLKEKNQMKQAYGMRGHGPMCYSCGVQGHIRRDCFRFVQGANHGGFGLRNTWSRRLITMEMVEWDFLLTLEDMDLHISF
uniref:CCHC-type domain-containing protein n=1 Tax=Brassica oleracea var. oleracea TaxID=109376 RepID=A0A0D3CTV0_BRAOL